MDDPVFHTSYDSIRNGLALFPFLLGELQDCIGKGPPFLIRVMEFGHGSTGYPICDRIKDFLRVPLRIFPLAQRFGKVGRGGLQVCRKRSFPIPIRAVAVSAGFFVDLLSLVQQFRCLFRCFLTQPEVREGQGDQEKRPHKHYP